MARAVCIWKSSVPRRSGRALGLHRMLRHMWMRFLAMVLSVFYGIALWVGAGVLTGGGHAAMFLAPMALGPVGYATFFSAGFFHDPDSRLFPYVGAFDTVQFCLAVFGWTALVALLWSSRLGLRACFVGVTVLFYLVTLATWMHMALSDSRMAVAPGTALHVVALIAVFLAGQLGLWWLFQRTRT